MLDDRLDVIATDHAPHTLAEKGLFRDAGQLRPVGGDEYEKAHAGLPLVQHSLSLMLYYHSQGRISLEKIAAKMSHAVADCFAIKERGYIREGYHADLVIVDTAAPWKVKESNILYKCGWSPLENFSFPASVTHTFINGNLVYAEGKVQEIEPGQRLQFER